MVRRLRSLEEVPLDVFEAVKRAFIRQGIIRRNPRQKPAKGTDKLRDLTDRARDVLFKADTIFPFSLFPDTIILDREKLTIVNRFFFRVAKINSVPIADIQSIEADVGPFFGSIHVTSRYFVTNPQSVHFLTREATSKLQHLLQGYIIAFERDIDCSEIEKKQLVTLLNDLGQGASD